MTLQYIQPHEHEKLSQVELLVVDEAAAIPLPLVKSLLGPYLVFLSSTVNGYMSCVAYTVSFAYDKRCSNFSSLSFCFVCALKLMALNQLTYFGFFFFQSYEGTGRSLSLKLLLQLEEQDWISSKSTASAVSGTSTFLYK